MSTSTVYRLALNDDMYAGPFRTELIKGARNYKNFKVCLAACLENPFEESPFTNRRYNYSKLNWPFDDNLSRFLFAFPSLEAWYKIIDRCARITWEHGFSEREFWSSYQRVAERFVLYEIEVEEEHIWDSRRREQCVFNHVYHVKSDPNKL